MDKRHEVLSWFKALPADERMQHMIDLFSCCNALELRYCSTYFFGLKLLAGKEHVNYDCLGTLMDSRTRGQLVIVLTFLEHDNCSFANHIYNFLQKYLREKFQWKEILSNETALKQIYLLLTLAANHPAFRFTQKSYLHDVLWQLKNSELIGEGKLHFLCEEMRDLLSEDLFEPGSVRNHKDVLLKSWSSSSTESGFKDLSVEEQLLSGSPSKEHENISLEQGPYSQGPKEHENISSDQGPHLQGPSKEHENIFPEQEPHSQGLSKEHGHISTEPYSSSPKQSADHVSQDEQFSSDTKTDRVSQEQPSAASPLKENATSKRELSVSGELKQVVDVETEQQLPSGVAEINKSTSQEQLSSSSLESVEFDTLKPAVNPPTTSPVILSRSVSGRSGKIRDIELKGIGKKGAYKIEVTWSIGKKTESLKTFKELKALREMVVGLASDESLLKEINKETSTFLDFSSIKSFGEGLVEKFEKIAIFLREVATVLPLSIRDHEHVTTFFQPSNNQAPRPILVGQGNMYMYQESFMQKLNTITLGAAYSHPPYRNRNHGRTGFPDRQFRNSTGNWNSNNGPFWNYHKNHSFTHGKQQQKLKWKFYPPISTSSSQNSGSSQNSRSPSPKLESATGTSSLKNKKYLKINNGCTPLETKSFETKPGGALSNRCSNDKENCEKGVILTKA